MADEKRWTTDIKDWKKVDKPIADFFLQQSEEGLKETLQTANTISTKTERLIGILLPIETSLFVYIFNNHTSWCSYLVLTATLCSIVIFAALVLLYLSYEQYKIYTTGEMPSNIVREKFVNNSVGDNTAKYNALILNACENIQNRITLNDKKNAARRHKTVIAMRFLAATIICPLLSALLHLCWSH